MTTTNNPEQFLREHILEQSVSGNTIVEFRYDRFSLFAVRDYHVKRDVVEYSAYPFIRNSDGTYTYYALRLDWEFASETVIKSLDNMDDDIAKFEADVKPLFASKFLDDVFTMANAGFTLEQQNNPELLAELRRIQPDVITPGAE